MSGDTTKAVSDLKRRAERAAAAIVAEYDAQLPGVSREVVVLLIALGWIEGRQTGGNEAREIMRAEFANIVRSGLNSVKS